MKIAVCGKPCGGTPPIDEMIGDYVTHDGETQLE